MHIVWFSCIKCDYLRVFFFSNMVLAVVGVNKQVWDCSIVGYVERKGGVN